MYQHRNWQGAFLNLPVNKIVCVGSNYADHIREMGSAQAEEPILFIKPETALCDISQPILIPKEQGRVHHEIELAVLLGNELKHASEKSVSAAIVGYGIALDLTLRDIQAECKRMSHPWEKAKGFDGSCPISGFIPANQFDHLQQAQLTLTVNREVRQNSNTNAMITPIIPLISYMSRFFTLRAGDIILTGTPAGVGPLSAGDVVTVCLNEHRLTTRII